MMVENREDIEELIALFLSGEADPVQAMKLNEWRRQHKDNQALFDMLETIYNATTDQQKYKSVDVEEGWKKVLFNLEKEPKVIPIWKNRQFYIGAAAIAIVAFIIGGLWQDSPNIQQKISEAPVKDSKQLQPTYLTASNDVETFVLKDNSKIQLKPGSRIEVMDGFNEEQRLLKLEGSGTFDVVHDEELPFLIQVEDLTIKDIGTVFDVSTFNDTVKVVVSEGEVQLQLNGVMLNMVEGDSAFYVISQQLISTYKTPKARQDKFFEFNGTSLKEVTIILSEFFNRDIKIMDKEIESCTVSVTFKNESLPTILDIIGELLDVKVVRNNETIEIYGKSCI